MTFSDIIFGVLVTLKTTEFLSTSDDYSKAVTEILKCFEPGKPFQT